MKDLQKYNKAYVPVIVGVVLLVLSQVGVTEDMTVEELVGFIVASAAVYLVPNKK